MSKQPPPAPTASAIGPCPTLIENCRTPRHWKFTQHHRTTRPTPKTTQQFDLIRGGETFISSTTINVGHISAGEMRFNLEDYFGPGDIEAKNISVQVEKEKLKLKFLR